MKSTPSSDLDGLPLRTAPFEKPPHRRRKILLITSTIVFALIIGGVIFGFWEEYQLSQPFGVPPLTRNYTNTKYGFSLRVPEDWSVIEIDEVDEYAPPGLRIATVIRTPWGHPEESATALAADADLEFSRPFSEYVPQYKLRVYRYEAQQNNTRIDLVGRQRIVGGMEAYELSYRLTSSGTNDACFGTEIIVDGVTISYILQYSHCAENEVVTKLKYEKYLPTFNHIVESFQIEWGPEIGSS